MPTATTAAFPLPLPPVATFDVHHADVASADALERLALSMRSIVVARRGESPDEYAARAASDVRVVQLVRSAALRARAIEGAAAMQYLGIRMLYVLLSDPEPVPVEDRAMVEEAVSRADAVILAVRVLGVVVDRAGVPELGAWLYEVYRELGEAFACVWAAMAAGRAAALAERQPPLGGMVN